MREILFHGKRLDNGQWVEGYYFERKDTQGNIIESVIIVDAYEQISGGQRYVRSNLNHECFRVDPDTVGQFTGLTDKNSRKVFEGDVCRFYGAEDYSDYAVFWDDSASQWAVRQIGWDAKDVLDIYFAECCEVIGNIHDNPELLDQ